MKKYISGLIIMIIWSVISCAAASFISDRIYIEEDAAEETRILVAVQEGKQLSSEYAGCRLSDIEKISDGVIDGENAVFYVAGMDYDNDKYSLDEALRILSDEDEVLAAEEDLDMYTDAVPTTLTDPYMKEQWYFSTIGADSAWKTINSKGNTPGNGVVVAVIDTGVDYTHSELRNSMWINRSEYLGRSGVDDDRNGVVDDIYGANFSGEETGSSTFPRLSSSDGNPMDTDPDGHGTHVAGIIAMGAGNGGAAGIAYGAQIMAVKAGNSEGYFKVSNVLKAINYAAQMDADIINMSFGTYGESTIIKAALEKASKECIIVAACGNDGFPNSESDAKDAKTVYPASYPFVIGVMAADKDNNITSWSNYDAVPFTDNEYELAAPGFNILSCVPDGKYAYMSGTSMAAPVVSSAAAILLAEADVPSDASPAGYVFSQLVNSSGHVARKTEKSGKVITYPLVNIADSLGVEQGINIELSNLMFYDFTNKKMINGPYIVTGETKIVIDCGFFIKNTWGAASDVEVKIDVDNDSCKLDDEDIISIGDMASGAFYDISCDKEEAFRFMLEGEIGKTYTIPVRLNVNWKGGSKTFTETLKVSFNYATPAPASGADNQNDSVIQSGLSEDVNMTGPTKPNVKAGKNYYTVKWDNLLKADEYILYRSKGNKKSFKKIAAVKAEAGKTSFSYKDKNVKAGVKYYYRIKAVYSDRTESGNSEIAEIIRPAKVKKIKSSGSRLTWKRAAGAAAYQIYYSYKKNSGYKKAGSTKKNSYTLPEKLIKKNGSGNGSGNGKMYIKIRGVSGGSNKAYGKMSGIKILNIL